MAEDLSVLFVYRFCTRGGVESILRNRLETLKDHFGQVHADILFLKDMGGSVLFKGDLAGHVFFKDIPGDIRDLIRKRGYGYVISIDTPEIFPLVRGLNVKKVLEVHTHYNDNRRYLSSVVREEPDIAAITVPSEYFRDMVVREAGIAIPVYTFPNFVGKDYSSPAGRQPPPTWQCHKAIGWAGRLDGLKNWEEFLEIGRHILASRADVELLIVGDTHGRAEKKKFFDHLSGAGLLPCVRWLPFCPDMPAFYRYLAGTGGCFVSTSRGESFGMTVLEAMASKCPVVCTDIGAYSELLCSGKYGPLYPPGKVSEAVAGIGRILDDREYRDRLITDAHAHVQRDYDPERIVTGWIDRIKQL